MTDVVVVGAGPTGLMAALQARKRGFDCTVIEASTHVGGMTGSFEVAGHRVDYGSHRLHPATNPELLGLIGDLLGSDLQERPRSGRIHLGGRWVGFPLRTTNLLRNLPPPMTAKLVTDSVAGLLPKKPTGSTSDSWSFHDEVASRLGRTVADQFYGPYAIKLYGTTPQELSPELAHRRVSAASPTDIVRRLARATRSAGRSFYYPKHGYGQIAERLADAATDAGASIELANPITGVVVDDDHVVVSTATTSRDAGVALSTIPVTRLASMLDPGPPAAVAEALNQVKTRAMMLVYLVLDRPQYTSFDAHYIPGLDTTVARLSEPKNYRDGDDPHGTTVLCAEIACWADDKIWSWSPTQLADLVVEDLQRVGLPEARYIDCEVRRLPSVYPVYDLATIEARAIVDSWTGSGNRLLTLGRQGLRVIDNLHHVLAMGQGAIDSIDDDGAIDLQIWQTKLDRFAKNTVED